MPRREVNVSGVFSALTKPGPVGEEERPLNNAAEESPEPPKTHAGTVPANERAAESKPAKSAKPKPADGSAKRRGKDASVAPEDRQTQKFAYYLTPRIHEAFKLYKATHFVGSHKDSEIVNQALAEFFKNELEALAAVDKELSENEKLAAAAQLLHR